MESPSQLPPTHGPTSSQPSFVRATEAIPARARPQPLGALPPYSPAEIEIEDKTPTTANTLRPPWTSASPTRGVSSRSEIPVIPPRRPRQSHPGCTLCSKYELAYTSHHESRHSFRSSANSSNDSDRPNTPLKSPLPTSPYGSPGYNTSTQSPLASSSSLSVATTDSVLFVDDDFLVYRVPDKEAVCKDGRHLVVVLAKHLDSVYELGPNDVPVLNKIQQVALRLLEDASTAKGKGKAIETDHPKEQEIRIGFIVSPFKDSLHPYKHIHIHVLVPPLDNASFLRRNFAFGGLWAPGSVGWWEMEDLIAEIREDSSNNRIKSGYGGSRKDAPIAGVMNAGSMQGLPNALEDTSLPSAHTYSAFLSNESREVALLEKRRDEYLSEDIEERYPAKDDEETGRGMWKSVEMHSPNLEVFQMGEGAGALGDSRRDSWASQPEPDMGTGTHTRALSPLSGGTRESGERQKKMVNTT